MSTRFIVAAGAAAVTAYFAPQYAAAAFSVVYGVTGGLDPNAKVQGPRLDDLKTATGSYGAPIPYVEGHPRLGGNIVWCTDKREIDTTTTTSAKGGPKVDNTSYTYEVDLLILISENPGTLVRRAFSNGALIWTRADNSSAESLGASGDTDSWREIRFYPGHDDQMPDPTYEAAVGIGNAPAYRGRSSIAIVGLNLGNSGQMPVLTFEVVANAVNITVADNYTTLPVYNGYSVGVPAFSSKGFLQLMGQWDAPAGQSQTTTFVYKVAADGTYARVGQTFAPFAGLCSWGNTDESGLFSVQNLGDHYQLQWTYYDQDLLTGDDSNVSGAYVGMDVPYGYNPGRVTFSKLGDNICVAGQGENFLFRFSRANGNLKAQAKICPHYNYLAIGGGNLYCLSEDTKTIDQRLLSDLTLITSFSVPAPSSPVIVCDEFGSLFAVYYGKIQKRVNDTWVLVYEVPSEFANYFGNYPDAAIAIRENTVFTMVGGSGYTIPIFRAQLGLALVEPELSDVVKRQWMRSGLDQELLDASALSGKKVHALGVSQITSPRQVIENLAAVYQFEAVESDHIRMVPRGGAPVAVIPYADMGASTSDPIVEALPRVRGNELEVVSQVTVTYSNIDDDYQDGSETSSRLSTGSTIVSTAQVPIGMTPTEAKRLAEITATDAIASILTLGPFAVTRKWASLEPTDVVILTGKDGSQYRTRIMKRTDSGGLLTFEGISDDANAVVSNAQTSGGYTNSTLVRSTVGTVVEFLDIPILRDVDDSPGFYVAAKPSSNGKWSGYALLVSLDHSNFSSLYTSTSAATMGKCNTTLGTFSAGTVFDEQNWLTVDVGDGELESVTRDVVLQSIANAAVVGNEIIQFRNATLLSHGVYLLSGLLRGRRGTEWRIPSHVAGERFVLLEPSTLRRVADKQADIGVPRYWKAVTVSQSADSVGAVQFTDTGISEKPFSVVDMRKSGDASEVDVTWKRRTRLASRFVGTAGINVPLGESAESYVVRLTNPANVLVTSETVTVPQWSGTASQAVITLQFPIYAMRTISGELVGITDSLPGSPYNAAKGLIRYDSSGITIQNSETLGQEIYQMANDGDNLYVATAEFTRGVPTGYANGKIQLISRLDLSTVIATYTASTPGDPVGVASDGGNVWMTEQYGGSLCKLDKTTLSSIATYPLNAGIGALVYDSGSLWITSSSTNEIIQWGISAASVMKRIPCISGPFDVLVIAGKLFVLGGSALAIYDTATGSLIASQPLTPAYYLAQRCMCLFESNIAVVNGNKAYIFDGATGAFVRELAANSTYLFYVAGSSGSTLYMTVGAPGISASTKGYQLAAPALSGYTITVQQQSANAIGVPSSLLL